LTYFAAFSPTQPKSHSWVTGKPIHFLGTTDDTHQDFSSSDSRDVRGFRGGTAWLGAEQARKVFPEDQIQLIEIEARVFDDLADLETERQCRVVRS
jgi:hypothetical protein